MSLEFVIQNVTYLYKTPWYHKYLYLLRSSIRPYSLHYVHIVFSFLRRQPLCSIQPRNRPPFTTPLALVRSRRPRNVVRSRSQPCHIKKPRTASGREYRDLFPAVFWLDRKRVHHVQCMANDSRRVRRTVFVFFSSFHSRGTDLNCHGS